MEKKEVKVWHSADSNGGSGHRADIRYDISAESLRLGMAAMDPRYDDWKSFSFNYPEDGHRHQF